MLTQDAIAKLKKVKEHILAEPRRLNMDTWLTTNEYRNVMVDTYASSVPAYEFAECGTAACIAGWTVKLNSKDFDITTDSIPNIATAILGLNSYPSSASILAGNVDDDMWYGKLFYPLQWDGDWGVKYSRSTSVEEKAQVAADYIEYFIETRGQQKEFV